MGSESGRHSRSSLAIAAWELHHLALNRFGELNAQRLVIAGEVVISAPPLQVELKFGGELSGTPRTANQEGNPLTDGQVEALDEGSVEVSGKTKSLQAGFEPGKFPP